MNDGGHLVESPYAAHRDLGGQPFLASGQIDLFTVRGLLHGARSDHVHADALGGLLDRQSPGEGVEFAFAGSVRRILGGRRDEGGNRSVITIAPP